jgi:putative ABC transport system ATP-binding protein
MIKIENLYKIFRNNDIETVAINNLNLEIRQGEFISIIGPSGCGKSSLLNIIGLLDYPTSGKYHLFGKDVSQYSEKNRTKFRKENIGFIFQSFNLIDELTVFENIELPLIYLKYSASKRKKMVDEMLDKMNLIHKKKFLPQQLSGGQQQKTAIARAIISNPKILLADEPTGNLDSSNSSEIMKLLKMINDNGSTILMVTHAIADAETANRIIQLFDGHILTEKIKSKKINFRSEKIIF